jgi:hypothetical protein
MSFCEHCHGQRFDRSRVLRALRQVRKDWFREHGGKCDAALAAALQAVRALDIPHLEPDEVGPDEVIH